MSHPVVLVDEDDRPLGTAKKLRAHSKGWLHRAFSIFVFDPEGRLLLQQRTEQKYHSGGLWTNTCCSHPRPGESPHDAAHRRLPEEMGLDVSLTPLFQKRYNLPVGDDLTEHEHNHVFLGTVANPDIFPSPAEVADWEWAHPADLRTDVTTHPSQYTTWFRFLLPLVLDAAPAVPQGPPFSADAASN